MAKQSVTKKRLESLAILAGLGIKFSTEGGKLLIIVHSGTWHEEFYTNKEAGAFLRGYVRGKNT